MKQELIALGETVGVENRGLSEAEINKYLRPLACNSTSDLLIDRYLSLIYALNFIKKKLLNLIIKLLKVNKM